MKLKTHIWILMNLLGIGSLSMMYLVITGHLYVAAFVGALMVIYGNLHGHYISKVTKREILDLVEKFVDTFTGFNGSSEFEKMLREKDIKD